MNFSFRPANRSQAKPLIGLYSESGAGKTYSALLLARGFVGDKGKIGMIETESGRGEAYADVIPGGYEVLPIRETFSPETYGQALTAAEKSKLDALIIDSASHEWEGAGGVLSMAALNQADGKKGPLVWQKPKLDHQRHFMLRLMQTPIPLVIVCMRAKYPMVERKNAKGEKEWFRSTELEPKQADDILFEMFVHGWISRGDHAFHATKYTRPDLREIIRDNEPITIDTGRRLATWASGVELPRQTGKPAAAKAAPAPAQKPDPASGAGAARSETESETINRLDRVLAAAAEQGEDALKAAWKGIDQEHRRILKAALDKRHKPRAAEVDLAKEGSLI